MELARRAQPDLVISDILMPVMDGFALCRAWKEDERLKEIPFVFYTATYTDPRDEAFALSLGADRFIIKPAEPDKFLALIQSTIKNHATGKLVSPHELIDETKYLEQYNSALIRKLEDKVLQLEQANRALELDITRRKQAEEALTTEQFLLQSLIDNIPDSIYFKDKVSCFIRINKALAERFGLSDPELAVGKNDFDFFSEEHAQQAYEEEHRIIQSGKPLVNIEEKEIWFDRPDTWVSTTKMPLCDQHGTIIGTFGLSREITERMLAEQQIQADLKEKTVLLQEVHHRVKNNLAIISALLEMQAAASQDDQVRAAFKISQGRILAMAAVHEQLYRSQKLSQIDMLNYVEALTEGLLASDILSEVKISVAVLDVALDIDHAIPCGLIINELATNAMKYAFQNIQNADKQEK